MRPADRPAMFITDFDGTLLTDRKSVDSQDLAALAALRSENVVTAIATGRSLFSFNRALDQMDMARSDVPADYLIFSTGAGVWDLSRGEILLSHALSREDIHTITGYFDGMGLDYMVQDAIPRTEYFMFKSHGGMNPDFHRRIEFYPSLGRPIKDRSGLFPSATQVLAIVPGGIRRREFQEIRQALARFSVILATSPLDHESAWVEVFPREVSKSRSAQWLASRLGIEQKDVTAVGNDYNDQDLLEWAGQGFVVENGPTDMKSGFQVVPSNNHCGVRQAARAALMPA